MLKINCQSTDRELDAARQKEEVIRKYFENVRVPYDHFTLFIRAFKKDRRLELWVRKNQNTSYVPLNSYYFCAGSGDLGPKRVEGDHQIPEGIYQIDRFNPRSRFYLSLGINYPNKSDRLLGDQKKPGSDIFIHGKCRSVGCIAITDEKIKEVYTIARKAVQYGQTSIRIDIYPFDFSETKNNYLWTEAAYESYNDFWKQLRRVFLHFESEKVPADFSIDDEGQYQIADDNE